MARFQHYSPLWFVCSLFVCSWLSFFLFFTFFFLPRVHVTKVSWIRGVCWPSLYPWVGNSCVTILCLPNVRLLRRVILETRGLQSIVFMKDRHKTLNWRQFVLLFVSSPPPPTTTRHTVQAFLIKNICQSLVILLSWLKNFRLLGSYININITKKLLDTLYLLSVSHTCLAVKSCNSIWADALVGTYLVLARSTIFARVTSFAFINIWKWT